MANRRKEQQTPKSGIDLNSNCVNYNNVSQGIIHITEDKLKVILLEQKEKNKLFYSWTTPLGIFVSCLLTTITADFKNTLGLSSNTWKAIFVILTVITLVWLLWAAFNAFSNRKNRKIDDLINTIKNSYENNRIDY